MSAGQIVQVIAPSGSIGAIFPHVRDLGVQRLQSVLEAAFKCETPPSVVLANTARQAANSPEEKARELQKAWEDDAAVGLVCTTGGDRPQSALKVLKYLEKIGGLRRKDASSPPFFFGYLDMTHLHLYLGAQGIPAYYGAALMPQFGLSGPGITAECRESVLHAFAKTDWVEVPAPAYVIPDYHDWSGPANLEREPRKVAFPGKLHWETVGVAGSDGQSVENPAKRVRGTLFGGCLECIFGHLAAGREFVPPQKLVLFLETSEEMPSAEFVYEAMAVLGERGLLSPDRLQAVLVARPKTEFFLVGEAKPDAEGYRKAQREAILKALTEYTMGGDVLDKPADRPIPVVFNLLAGHSDPQIVIPLLREAVLDVKAEQVWFSYRR